MSNRKMIIVGFLGTLFVLLEFYFRFFGSGETGFSYGFLGIGTWLAGVAYYSLYPKYQALASLLLGLLVLHAGVILILVEDVSYPGVLGFLVFTGGVVVVLNSGVSEYLHERKANQ